MTQPKPECTQPVRRIDQSPMNKQRWCLELTCGHEVWITATRRPKRAFAECPLCQPPKATP